MRKCFLSTLMEVQICAFEAHAFYPHVPLRPACPRWVWANTSHALACLAGSLWRVGPWGSTQLGDITVKSTGLAHARTLVSQWYKHHLLQ